MVSTQRHSCSLGINLNSMESNLRLIHTVMLPGFSALSGEKRLSSHPRLWRVQLGRQVIIKMPYTRTLTQNRRGNLVGRSSGPSSPPLPPSTSFPLPSVTGLSAAHCFTRLCSRDDARHFEGSLVPRLEQ